MAEEKVTTAPAAQAPGGERKEEKRQSAGIRRGAYLLLVQQYDCNCFGRQGQHDCLVHRRFSRLQRHQEKHSVCRANHQQ